MTSRNEARTAVKNALNLHAFRGLVQTNYAFESVWPVVDELITDRDLFRARWLDAESRRDAAQAALEAERAKSVEMARLLRDGATAIETLQAALEALRAEHESLRDVLAVSEADRQDYAEAAHRATVALEALQTENAAMRTALEVCLPVVVFVSRGRGYVGCETYPDATARRANFLVGEILFKNTVDARALLGSPKEDKNA